MENAKAFLRTAEGFGSFDAFLWHYTDGVPIVSAPRSVRDIPAQTPLSCEIAKDLKRRGFRFLGPTIVYSYLQAVGVVNDHTEDCFVYRELCGERGSHTIV